MSGGGVVAVLFTDLVGSTEILARLGDDAAEDLRRRHFAILRRAITEAGGKEVKSLGDGLMVAFTSVLGAVGCAVAMQRAIDGHNRRGAGPALRVRVGLHAGEPARDDDDDLQGTSVVVARRLCDSAQGGEILASQLVAQLVGSRGGFRFLSRGSLRLKGLPQPQPTVAVTWADAAAGVGRSPGPTAVRQRAPSGRGPAFVGREQEFGVLRTELARARGGEFRCVLLVGEAGVGKTRLASEFVARDRGVVGLFARAYPLGGTASFGLWAEALEGQLRTLSDETILQLCGGYLDDLAALLRRVAAVRGWAPEREPPRMRLLEGLAVVLGNLARQAPTVVVLDDVHLADASSWDGLRYLAHHLADVPILVVATARRPELADHAEASEVLFSLEQEGMVRRVVLGPLTTDGLRRLAAGVVGEEPPTALVDWLSDRTRGNTLFALGLIRALLDEGADLAHPRLRQLPEALADRVRSRLRSLEEPWLATLEVLAVLGRRVDVGELTTLTARPRERLDEFLGELVRVRLVFEVERGTTLTYEIAHPLIQEAIYEGMAAGRRRALHRLVARGLVTVGRLDEAAAHFSRGAEMGDDEAITTVREALRQAEEREADREALELLGTLVDLVPPGDGRWAAVAEVVSRPAEWVMAHRADNAERGIRAMREVVSVLAPSSDVLLRANVALRLASLLAWGTAEFAEAERICRQAIDLFDRGRDRRRWHLASTELAWIHGLDGANRAFEEESRDLVEVARRDGDRYALLLALIAMGNGAFFRGRFAVAEVALCQSAAIAVEEVKPYEQMRSLAVLAFSFAFEGRMKEALAVVDQAKLANPAVPPTWEPGVHWMRGSFRDTLASIERAIAWRPIGVSRRRAMLLALAALSATEAGQLTEAERYLGGAQSAYGDRPFMFFTHYTAYAGALLAARKGHEEEAVTALRHVVERMLGMEAHALAAPILVDLTELACETGRKSVATEAATWLGVTAERVGRPLYDALAALGAAYVALAAGSTDQAAERAGTVIEVLGTLGYEGFLGRALHVLGTALSHSDRPRAVAALERAAAIFDACDARWRRDRALGVLRAIGGQGHRAAGAILGPVSLTRREREVARLASGGLTAAQIAGQLFIAERTVEGHLANVYAKLGVRSKLDLVRRASELAL